MFGYGMIDTVVGGQMLSAVADGHLSVAVGVIIVAVISWAIAVIGIKAIHPYEKYGWCTMGDYILRYIFHNRYRDMLCQRLVFHHIRIRINT